MNDNRPDCSRDELIDDLADLLDSVNDESFSQSRLDGILNALDELDPVEEIDVEASLADFHSTFAPLFENDKKSEVINQRSTRRRHRLLSRTIVSFAALIMVLFIGMFAAQAAGIDVFGAIARWTDDIFQFSEKSGDTPTIVPLEEGEERSYLSLQEALDSCGVKEKLAPTWVPKGYQIIEVKASIDPGSNLTIFCIYFNGNDYLTITIRGIKNGEYSAIQKDPEKVMSFEHNGITHYLMSNLDNVTSAWTNSGWECVISGPVSVDDLKSMILSIYK